MGKIEEAAPNFIRCVKPNSEKVANKFTSQLVLEQANSSLEYDLDETSFLQVGQATVSSAAQEIWHGGLRTKSLHHLCLVPLLIALNLGFAFVMQFISRRSRLTATKRDLKADENLEDAAVIRDLRGAYAVFKIVQSWLNSPGYKLAARTICVGTIVHWFLREFIHAHFLSNLQAELTNAVVKLPTDHDVSNVYSCLYTMLAWQLATAPLFFILDPMMGMWFSTSLQSYVTTAMIKEYINGGGQAYYKLKMDDEKRDIDNPDQRIADATEQFCFMLYVLWSGFLSAIFGSLAWAGVMITLGGMPLFVTCVGMAFLRLMISVSGFGNLLVDAYKEVLETGATLRYSLTRIREHAEPIALSHGDVVEEQRTKSFFYVHLDAMRNNVFVNMLFNTTLGIIDFFPVVILWFYQIPSIMSGTLLMGDAVRCQTGYQQVAKVMDFLATSFAKLKQLQAAGERLTQLWEASEEANSVPPGSSQIEYTVADPSVAFEIDMLFVSAPGSSAQVGGASLLCEVGQGLLVTGSSGVGKSSILRSIAGLWSAGEGSVAKSAGAEVFFLPQNSYFPEGTLLEAVIYPARLPEEGAERSGLEVQTTMAMKKAMLGPLLRKWGLQEARDWSTVLSAGERQRLGFARLFMLLALRARREEKRKLSSRSQSMGRSSFSRAQSTSHLGQSQGGLDDWTRSSPRGLPIRRGIRSHGNDLFMAGRKDAKSSETRLSGLQKQTALSLVDLQQASALCGELPSTGVIAVLDESTSAVEVSVEAALYSELRKELRRGTLLAMASVSHRPSLPQYHDTELIIAEADTDDPRRVLDQGLWNTPHGTQVPWRHVSLGSAPSTPRSGGPSGGAAGFIRTASNI